MKVLVAFLLLDCVLALTVFAWDNHFWRPDFPQHRFCVPNGGGCISDCQLDSIQERCHHITTRAATISIAVIVGVAALGVIAGLGLRLRSRDRLSETRVIKLAVAAALAVSGVVIAVVLALTLVPKPKPFFSCGMYPPTHLALNTYYAGC